MTATRLTGLLVPTLLALSMSTALQAQTAPPAGTVLKQTTPPPSLPTAPQSVIELPAPAQQSAASATPIPVHQVQIQGNTLIATPDLQPLVRSLDGRTVTLGDLQQAAQRITDLYRARGYPLAHAYVPAQSIRNGVVRVVVIEPRFDRIRIDNASRLSSPQARRTLDLRSGQTITDDNLDRGLLLLNRTPGVRVAGTLVPGAQPATSSLQVKLDSTPVLHTQLFADNYGNASTGRARGGVNLNLDNPFGHGAQLAFNALTSAGGLLHAGGFNFTSPDLRNGLRAGVYGSRTLYRLGGDFAALGIRGRVNQAGVDLDYPLILRPGRLLQVRLDLLRNGFDQNNATASTLGHSHIRMTRLSLSGVRADAHGNTSGGLSISHGNLSLDNADARLTDSSGPQAGGAFWVAQLQALRSQKLPAHWTLNAGIEAQLASHPLDGSQQFYLGGPYAVMSAPVSAGGGDAGVLLDVRLAHALLDVGAQHLSGSFLLQSGKAWRRGSASGSPQSTHLSGAGLGLDYRFERRVQASLTYVHGLGNTRTPDGTRTDGEFWGRVSIDL
ncbi:hypothetical protein GCM10027285_26450 [Oleiagrimonas citrea]|uniref:ShlB/FhaC/HecB family hemolysin secretion/activation protein n=1 Tax=Oleiagrimonas citrea TaxID=1665687 RepID=A0A846ZKY7_9GAMM|nr:ShlB/FhaC/HecB family hemolysin secretion/activation protein [Oleiagrimonas citrea]NKZ38985.1 ShlB/FhaC/HecB family hemolysin secretion/activation protein [Oleiagrimonas citrea]